VASNGVAVDSTFLNSRFQPEMVRTRFRSPGDPSRVYERHYWYQAANGLLDSVTATGPNLTLLSRGFAYTPTRGTLDSLRFGAGAWTRLHRNWDLQVDTTRFPNGDALALGYVTADDLDRISSPLMDDRVTTSQGSGAINVDADDVWGECGETGESFDDRFWGLWNRGCTRTRPSRWLRPGLCLGPTSLAEPGRLRWGRTSQVGNTKRRKPGCLESSMPSI
jgi:hypothetical protein